MVKRMIKIVKKENVIMRENRLRLHLESDYMLTGLQRAIEANDEQEMAKCKERLKEIAEEITMIDSCERLLDKHRLS